MVPCAHVQAVTVLLDTAHTTTRDPLQRPRGARGRGELRVGVCGGESNVTWWLKKSIRRKRHDDSLPKSCLDRACVPCMASMHGMCV